MQNLKGTIFITGFSTFYKLFGEQELKKFLTRIVSFTASGLHIILMCFQCDKQLNFSDTRYRSWVYCVEGEKSNKTDIILLSSPAPIPKKIDIVNDIHKFPSVIESKTLVTLSVKTSKKKEDYPYSLINILNQANSYEQLCSISSLTAKVPQSYGTEKQWAYALDEINKAASWENYAEKNFGNVNALELSLQKWYEFDENKKWIYFILLKLFGTPDNLYLDNVITNSFCTDDIIKEIYQNILLYNCSDANFDRFYKERKQLITCIGESDLQVSDFCDWVQSKEKNAIYYLTDMTSKEIYLIFKILNDYYNEFTQDELMSVLKNIYHDLYDYITPYDYKIELLNNYFNLYKYQKVVNHILPQFKSIVDEQALKRDYISIFPSRSEKIESIDMSNTLVYFIDAMGVEYLSYIMARCQKYNLLAYTTLCHCEIPSLTCKNKDFVEVFKNKGGTFAKDENGIKSLDELKHHGKEDFDYNNNKLPTYISRELQIIAEIMKKIVSNLEKYDKVVIISDHGASRLAVINEKENNHEMQSKGIHSGRCCPKSESDIPPDCAVDSDDFWILANYDRFKGGRTANIEVHGGATLEEVVIPIIEITKTLSSYKFEIKTNNIKFSKRKKNASIEIYSKSKINDITVQISKIKGKLPASSTDGHNFKIEIPDLKYNGEYTVDVYLHDNLINNGLKFTAENSDFSEKKLL